LGIAGIYDLSSRSNAPVNTWTSYHTGAPQLFSLSSGHEKGVVFLAQKAGVIEGFFFPLRGSIISFLSCTGDTSVEISWITPDFGLSSLLAFREVPFFGVPCSTGLVLFPCLMLSIPISQHDFLRSLSFS
jgi:hypothetical protein